MANQNDNCTDAILAYANEVFAAIADGKMRLIEIADERWQRGSDGVARRQLVVRRVPLTGDPSSSPVYERACQAIRDDVDFGPLVGGIIGSSMGGSGFYEATVINGVLYALVNEQEAGVNENAVRREVAALRDYVRATERVSTVLIPLPGLQSSLFPLELEEGLQIDLLTDSEIDACASTGILQSISPRIPMLTANECVGVRIAITTPALTSPAGSQPALADGQAALASPHRFGDRSPWRVAELVEDVLFVLRLARPEFIGTRGAIHVLDRVMGGTAYSWFTRLTRHFVHTSYVIDQETAAAIRELWGLLRGQRQTHSLPSICSRRFNAAMDRVSLEDAIVDHVIAAEALFLKDAGSPEDRGELGFRLALRAGVWLETTGRDRRPTFKFMKRAYDLRSAVAHGGSALAEVPLAERGSIPLNQFVDELGHLMRDALKTAVREYASRSNFATSAFWDELLLGPPEAALSGG